MPELRTELSPEPEEPEPDRTELYGLVLSGPVLRSSSEPNFGNTKSLFSHKIDAIN